MNADGTFKHVQIGQKEYWGKNLLQKADRMLRTAYYEYHDKQRKRDAMDYVWYLWCGADTPTFDKSKMATFERYFVADKETYKEEKGHYYELRDQAEVCDNILREFGIEPGSHSHIINGHVPVRTIKGEKPVKADGKLLVTDDIPVLELEKAIKEGLDIKSTIFLVDYTRKRMMVKDTDKGREIREQINELQKLLVAYRSGLVQEKD